MKKNYDKAMKVKECLLKIGDRVLLRWNRTNKTMSIWDPNPYTVQETKGSMISASRTFPDNHSLTRNSSYFKLFRVYNDEEDILSRREDKCQGASVTMETSKTNEVEVETMVNTESVPKKRRLGRPTAQEQKLINEERSLEYNKKLMENPPLRRSARI